MTQRHLHCDYSCYYPSRCVDNVQCSTSYHCIERCSAKSVHCRHRSGYQ